ncbi:MAG: hypothetical protein V1755_14045, partial [Chloroflexota bacterium]
RLGGEATWLSGSSRASAVGRLVELCCEGATLEVSAENSRLRAENQRLRADLHHARCLAKILAHSYEHDSRPPQQVVSATMQYDATKAQP